MVMIRREEHDPIDVLSHMARLLDEQSVPEEGRWFLANPEFYEQLVQTSSKLMSVDFNAGQGSIRNGLVSSGKLRGFDMYKTNNIAATSNAAGKCIHNISEEESGHSGSVCARFASSTRHSGTRHARGTFATSSEQCVCT